MSPPPLPGAPVPGKGGKSPGEWLKTREGKLIAGGGAVLLVIVLALRRGAGGGPAADPTMGAGVDGTVQSTLDQLGGRGGTLDELTDTTTGLAGRVEDLMDLIERQNPLPPSTPKPTKALASGAKWHGNTVVVPWAINRRMTLRDIAASKSISKTPTGIESTLRWLVANNPALRDKTGRTVVPKGTRVLVPDSRYYNN